MNFERVGIPALLIKSRFRIILTAGILTKKSKKIWRPYSMSESTDLMNKVARAQALLVEEHSASEIVLQSTIVEQLRLYMMFLDRAPKRGSYRYDNSKMRSIRKSMAASHSDLFHRCLFLALIRRSSDVLVDKGFTESVAKLYRRDYERILDRITDIDTPFLDPDSDVYKKDLAVLTFRMIPLGPIKCHLKRIGLHAFFGKDIAQFCKLSKLLLDVGGVSPFLHMHTCSGDLFSMVDFAQTKKWKPFYSNVAELMIRDPRILGLTGSSWMNDPALEMISPKLYNNLYGQFDLKFDLFLCSNVTEHAYQDALRFDKNRKQLYENGVYKPQVYTIIFTRKNILDWYHNKD